MIASVPVRMGTGDLQHLLNEPVEYRGLHIVCGLVIDLLTFPAADNQVSAAQLAQMVGDGGAAHIHHGRQIDHALLAVAKNPEQLDPAAVTQLAQQFRDLLKIIAGGAFSITSAAD